MTPHPPAQAEPHGSASLVFCNKKAGPGGPLQYGVFSLVAAAHGSVGVRSLRRRAESVSGTGSGFRGTLRAWECLPGLRVVLRRTADRSGPAAPFPRDVRRSHRPDRRPVLRSFHLFRVRMRPGSAAKDLQLGTWRTPFSSERLLSLYSYWEKRQ